MRFWSNIWGWLGFGPGTEALAVPADLSAVTEDEPSPDPQQQEGAGQDASFIPQQAWWLFTENAITAPPCLQLDDDTTDAALIKELQAIIESPEIELPHLPHVPQRVLTLLRQTNVNYPAIAQVLSQDQTSSAATLRIANSAVFAGLKEIDNLEVALSRLGMKGIRNLMLQESVKAITVRKTSDGQSPVEMLWRKSLAAAVIMEQLAPLFRMSLEDAFLMGLLHDMGEVVLLRVTYDYQSSTGQEVSDRLFDYVCQEFHERLGGALAALWKLPHSIRSVMENHHGPISADDPHLTEKCLLQITDMLTGMMGYGRRYPYDLLNTRPAEQIGFGRDQRHISALADLPDLVRREQISSF